MSPGLKEKAGKGGGPFRTGSWTSIPLSGPASGGLGGCPSLMGCVPGLNVKAGRGAMLGFREVLRVCIGWTGTDSSDAVSKGENADTVVGIDTEAMLSTGR